MNNITKKTMIVAGGTVAAAALAVVGVAGPASADATSDRSGAFTSSQSSAPQTATDLTNGDTLGDLIDLVGNVSLSDQSPLVIAPQVGAGDVATGDVASWNDVSAPVPAPDASVTDTVVDAPVVAALTGGDTSAETGAGVSDVVDDVTDVDGLLGGVAGNVDLESILGR
jgi:hypothetical protein